LDDLARMAYAMQNRAASWLPETNHALQSRQESTASPPSTRCFRDPISIVAVTLLLGCWSCREEKLAQVPYSRTRCRPKSSLICCLPLPPRTRAELPGRPSLQRPNDIDVWLSSSRPKGESHDNPGPGAAHCAAAHHKPNATTCSAPADRGFLRSAIACLIVKPYPSLIVSSAKSCFSVVIEKKQVCRSNSTFARRSACNGSIAAANTSEAIPQDLGPGLPQLQITSPRCFQLSLEALNALIDLIYLARLASTPVFTIAILFHHFGIRCLGSPDGIGVGVRQPTLEVRQSITERHFLQFERLNPVPQGPDLALLSSLNNPVQCNPA